MVGKADGELMELIARGNEAAFRELYRRYASLVLGYARRLVRELRQAEEIAQEVWLKVVRAASSYRGDGTVKSWLFTVTRRTSFNYLRDHTSPQEVATEDGEAPVGTISTDVFEERIFARADIHRIREAVDELPTNQRLALTLWMTEDLSYEEIAIELNVTEAAVKSLLHRARVTLEERLK